MTNQSKLDRIFDTISKKKTQSLNLFGVIGLIIILTYSLINFYLQDYPIAIFELFLSLVLLVDFYILNAFNKIWTAINIGNVILFILAVHNFNTGGFRQTGIMWIFVIVAFIFFINYKKAAVWIILITAVLLGLFALKISGFITLPYNNFYILMFFISLITSSILTYLYILKIEEGYNNIETTYADLQETLNSASIKELELEKLLNEINIKTEELENYIGLYGKSEKNSIERKHKK